MSLIIDGAPVPDTEWLTPEAPGSSQASWQSPQAPFAVSESFSESNDISIWVCATLDEVLRVVRSLLEDSEEDGEITYACSHNQSLYISRTNGEAMIEVMPYRPHELP